MQTNQLYNTTTFFKILSLKFFIHIEIKNDQKTGYQLYDGSIVK